ncbi:aminodeoxychorismate lyase [Arenimonas sp.]|uniref:aminodeoxychorismate lyase n=1 Tax=Arenimonas sp. TaxID=1872635 RepID=UPI0035B0C55C
MSLPATRLFRGREAVACLDPADRGLAYGDGLFETMRIAGGQVPWWDAHMARLGRGAGVLGIPLPDRDWLRAQVETLLGESPASAVLKLVLTRGAGGRGYAPPAAPEPGLVLSVHELPPAQGPLRLRWCRTRVSLQPALAGIKHLNRLDQVLARAEWHAPGIHEGLMLDASGNLACATAANLFALVDGRWLTPSLADGGVAGLARAWVLANEPAAAEAVLKPESLASAEALFLCNAVRGILPVGQLDDLHWPPHPATESLRRALGRELPAA